MSYEVSRARQRDVGKLVGLSAALFLEDAATRDPPTDAGWPGRHGRDHFVGLVSCEDALCLLASSGRTPVGYLAGLIRPPMAVRPVEIAELQSMYVTREHRGNGLGRDLVERFRAWAGDRGAERMSVTAYAANGRAIRFYERSGFRRTSITLEEAL